MRPRSTVPADVILVVDNWRSGKRGKDEHFQTLEIWIDLEDFHNFRSSDVS